MQRSLRRGRPRTSTSAQRGTVSADHPVQLQLTLIMPPVRSPATPAAISAKLPPIVDRLTGMDVRMSTSDVVRVVGVNRSTLFRWCKKGTFPQKHISGGWLRSDVEKWFAAKVIQDS